MKSPLTNGKAQVFEGWRYWKATASFNFDEDETWGHVGDEDGWQEECEYRSTDVSQCNFVLCCHRLLVTLLGAKFNIIRSSL